MINESPNWQWSVLPRLWTKSSPITSLLQEMFRYYTDQMIEQSDELCKETKLVSPLYIFILAQFRFWQDSVRVEYCNGQTKLSIQSNSKQSPAFSPNQVTISTISPPSDVQTNFANFPRSLIWKQFIHCLKFVFTCLTFTSSSRHFDKNHLSRSLKFDLKKFGQNILLSLKVWEFLKLGVSDFRVLGFWAFLDWII